MCIDCFNEEYKFRSDWELNDGAYSVFLKKFEKKISKTIIFIRNERYKFDSHSVYKCSSCEKFWWLSEPDNHKSGFFLEEQNAKKLIDKESLKGTFLILGMLLLVILILLLFIKFI